MNPAELEIALFCRGLRLPHGFDAAARITRTRAGLGSGLELIIPAEPKSIWVNAPVLEEFAAASPLVLLDAGTAGLMIRDERDGRRYPVRLREQPVWYGRRTRRGNLYQQIGVMQGTYLGIYIGPVCGFWRGQKQNCKFCTTGVNVGGSLEIIDKSVDEVVEVARAAVAESGVTFVHFNSGYQPGKGLEIVAPYVKAIKERVGAMVGVQLVPDPDLTNYDRLIDMGVEHFSFCYEFHNPDYFARYLPGKQEHIGQAAFFRALEHASARLGKGRCSGEVIAGVEPLADTLAAVDYITSVGAFPTVCVFRPLEGADMAQAEPPEYEQMLTVFRRVIEACRANDIPIGLAPNIEVSLIVNPADAAYLAPDTAAFRRYLRKQALLRALARPYFSWRMRRHKVADRFV